MPADGNQKQTAAKRASSIGAFKRAFSLGNLKPQRGARTSADFAPLGGYGQLGRLAAQVTPRIQQAGAVVNDATKRVAQSTVALKAADTFGRGARGAMHSGVEFLREKAKIPNDWNAHLEKRKTGWAAWADSKISNDFHGFSFASAAPEYYANKAKNTVVDLAADASHPVIDEAADFAGGVKDKIIPSTIKRYGISNAFLALNNPGDTREYALQKTRKIREEIPALVSDPISYGTAVALSIPAKTEDLIKSIRKNASKLDSGDYKYGVPMNAVRHAGRATKDYAQEAIAPHVGFGLAGLVAYNATRQVRQNTNDMHSRMFPKGTARGQLAKVPVLNKFGLRPFARVAGNPRVAVGLAVFSAVTGAGNAIRESRELQKRNPDQYRVLQAKRMQYSHASQTLAVGQSISKTSNRS